jgi:hypothetical protein
MNHDFVMHEEKRAPNSQRKGKAVSLRRRLHLLKMQADRIFIVALVVVAAIGIPLNALYLQDGRHPAPLFQPATPLLAHSERAPLPPPRPMGAATAHSALVKADVVPAEAIQPRLAQTREKLRDPIGLLLVGDAPQSGETDKKALFAQRALARLGYNVRVDGKFGGSTRQALEKFERDSGLPVRGELTAKVMRQLSSRSGVAIE